jgi:CubicO group peptidase (beta-lactamase class C family)
MRTELKRQLDVAALRLAVVVSLVLLQGCATAPEAPRGAGVNDARMKALGAQVRADVERGAIPGAVIVVARGGNVVYQDAIGWRDAGAKVPMTADSIFRIYSMTKPIVSVGLMMLVEEGRVQLSDPVSRHIPELKGLRVGVERKDAAGQATLELVAAAREPTLQDLMRHTSGFAYDFFGDSLVKREYRKNAVDAWDQTNAEFVKRLATVPLHYQPGTTWTTACRPTSSATSSSA